MRFVVVGAGAIGGVVGGRLIEHGHDVVFIARGPHGSAIAESGLRVASPAGSIRLDVEVVAAPGDLRFTSGDIVLLAVKSQDTVAALDRIAESADAAAVDVPIVCLQNGVHNESEALRRFRNVYGATVMCPAVHLIPGEVRAHSSPISGLIDVGRYPDGIDGTADAVVTALAKSTFSSLSRPDIMRWKWAKLLLNLGNVIEAACGPPARRGPLGKGVRSEGEAVLLAAGIDFASAAEDSERRGDLLRLGLVDGEKRPGGSSWQSLARGVSGIETDYLNGEIIRLGRIHEVPTPLNERLQKLVRQMISSAAPPGSIAEADVLEASTIPM